MKDFYSAKEIADILGCKVSTINTWYVFKREHLNQDDRYYQYAKMLPDFERHGIGTRAIRYWKKEDIEKLKQFKNSIPHGRNGILGNITRRYKRR